MVKAVISSFTIWSWQALFSNINPFRSAGLELYGAECGRLPSAALYIYITSVWALLKCIQKRSMGSTAFGKIERKPFHVKRRLSLISGVFLK